MIWRRKRRDPPDVPVPGKAASELARAREQTPKYRELAESLRELRQANNFAAAIETSFRGGNP